MIILPDLEQGSTAWIEARLAVVTASAVDKIITPGRMQLSKQRDGYMDEILAEWVTGKPADAIEQIDPTTGEPYYVFQGSRWTKRGSELEPEARKFYQMIRGIEIEKVGFIYKDESRLTGCSPDFVAADGSGGGEIKCPAPKKHMGTWRNVNKGVIEHLPQIQFQLWVTGWEWVDFLSYCPELPEALLRVEPRDEWQKALDKHIPVFLEEVDEERAKLIEQGYGPEEG